MNVVLQSCAASPLKSLLYSTSGTADTFSYGVRSNLPALSRTRVRVAPNSASLGWGDTLTFQCPRYGVCSGAYAVYHLKVWRHKGYAESIQRFTNFLGCFIADQYTLNTHDKVLQTINSEALLHDATYGVEANKRKTNALLLEEEPDHLLYQGAWADHNTGAQDFRVVKICVPLPFWQFANSNSYPDFSFLEPLTISMKLAASKNELMKAASATTLAGTIDDAYQGWEYKKAEVVFEFLAMSDTVKKQITDSNYSLSKPLTMLSTDTFVESRNKLTIPGNAAATGDNQHMTENYEMKVDIKCNGLCQNTYFRIVETTPARSEALDAAAANALTVGAPAIPADRYYNKGKSLAPSWTDYGSDAIIAPSDFAFARSGAEQFDADVVIADPRNAADIAADTALTAAQLSTQVLALSNPPSGVAAQNKTYCGWGTATITGSGTEIAVMHSDEVLLGFGGNQGRALSTMHANAAGSSSKSLGDKDRYLGQTDGFNTFSWSMVARPQDGGNHDAGSISYKEVVSPACTVSIPSHAATTYDRTFELIVQHTTMGLLSASSSDGRLTASVSV